MPINEKPQKPFVSITAYDSNGNELTSTIEIDCKSDADAIELWQLIRKFVTLGAIIRQKPVKH